MSNQAAIVLAAGKGTRMRSQTPKVLHRVCGKEMLALVVDAARQAGFDFPVVVVPPDSGDIRDALQDSVSYVVQSRPLGTGHALLQAQEALESSDDVVVMSGDVPLIRAETIESIMRHHLERDARVTLLTATFPQADGLGRVIRDEDGAISAINEAAEAGDDPGGTDSAEINAGVYCFKSSWLLPSLRALTPSDSNEVYLTDVVAMAAEQGVGVASVSASERHEALGVNTRVQLAAAETFLQRSMRERWMLSGVTMPDPETVYVEVDARLGEDTVVMPNTHIVGASRIGDRCQIGPNTIVDSSQIADGCRVVASVVEDSILDEGVSVGPFSHTRPGSHLEESVHIGNFAEITRSRLGAGTKSGHFSYLGDAEVGANVNIGAGTVTCNYDGSRKHPTRIGDGASIGSDSMLVAPVTIGARASTGAGAVVTKDVPADTLVVGVPAKESRRRAESEDSGR